MKKLKTILQYKYTFIFIIILSIINVSIRTIIIKYDSSYTNTTYNITGTIIDLNIYEDKISFILRSNEDIKCTYYTSNTDIYKYYLGKKVLVNITLDTPSNNTIPNNFNYKKYLYNNHIYKIGTINKIDIISNENTLYYLKNKILKRIDNISKDNITIKNYLNIFIVSSKDYLDNSLYNTYISNGIWHLFAVSGMHIGLIIYALNFLLKKFKYKEIIVSIFLLYLIFLTGASASVLRAVIFYILKLIFKDLSNIKILILTASLILFIDPFMIYNAGFLYSFIITLFIILSKSNTLFKVSFIAFLASIPISASINYQINLLSIILSFIYVPFVSLVVFPLSIIYFIFPCISFILKIIYFILETSNIYLNKLSLNIIIPKINLIIWSIYYILLYLYLKNKRYIMGIIIFIIIIKTIPKLDNNFYITYLDVKQGDSILLVPKNKKDITLIDTGSVYNTNISKNTLIYLKSIGLNKIDNLILTHGDNDHMGDALYILENFKVNNVIFNCGSYNDLEQELINELNKKNIKYYSCIKDLNIDKYKLNFLNTKIYDDENDNSSVIYLNYNNYKFLFMGDAGIEREKTILEKYNLSNIDFLKVGHHGSSTSSSKEFIDTIDPKYSLISVGKNNRYGHPKKEVLDILKRSNVYRTDRDGSIEIRIKSDGYSIETCEP